MKNFKSRLEALETIFVAQPDPDEIDRVRRRVQAGSELDADDERAIQRSGSIVVDDHDGVVIASIGSRGVILKRLLGVQSDWL